jgi:hypothetical protein
MSKRRAPDHDLTTEKAIKELFPKEAEEAATVAEGREPAAGAGEPDTAGSTSDARDKEVALRRLRDAPDEELAVFEDTLRQDASAAGATEQELRQAQSGQPGHG